MNIRQLTVFQILCEELSFTRTAERLCMTQPAVSHVIAELEEENRIVLFDRLGKKIYLTAGGQRFLEKSTRVLEAFSDLEKTAKEGSAASIIRLGACITIANTWLSAVLKSHQQRFGSGSLRVQVNSAAQIQSKLRSNELDMAFLEGELQNGTGSELSLTKISSYQMCFICSTDHPFSQRSSVSAEELVHQPLILREKGSAIRDALDSALLLRHLTADPFCTSVNSQAILATVSQGLGVSLLPQCLLAAEKLMGPLGIGGDNGKGRSGGISVFSVRGMDLANNNYIAVHKNKHWTEPMKALAESALILAES